MNVPIFSIPTPYAGITGKVSLLSNTWEKHIKPGHPEMSTQLSNIEAAIADPTYVAKSVTGAASQYLNNVVFVDSVPARTSALMVFVESSYPNATITTAFFSRKPKHLDVLWRKASPGLATSYDEVADILYIAKSEPRPAISEQDEDGVVLRFAMDDEAPCGVTVMSYRAHWLEDTDRLVGKIASFLNVSSESALAAVARGSP